MIEKWATIQRIAMSLLMVMVAGQPFANASLVSEKAGGVYIPEIAVEEKVEQADSRGIVAASETRFSPITAVKVDDEGIETQYAAVPQVEDIKSGAELELIRNVSTRDYKTRISDVHFTNYTAPALMIKLSL